MNGIHDLGGMHGFGEIVADPDEPYLPDATEMHIRALMAQSTRRKLFTLDAFRYGVERMEAAAYLRTPYIERWLCSIEYNLLHNGVLGRDELEARFDQLCREHGLSPAPGAPGSVIREFPVVCDDFPPESPAPRLAIGDSVIARNVHPERHTRLPRYVRGRRGVVHLVHEPQPLPEANAHGLEGHSGMVYNVRFEARELWGESAEANQFLYIDLWESYLDLALSLDGNGIPRRPEGA